MSCEVSEAVENCQKGINLLIQATVKERNKIYQHRNLLFVNLCSLFPGKYYYKDDDEWPIVYLDTPQGQMSYHFRKRSKEWRCFMKLWERNEFANPKEWDGHTPEDVSNILYSNVRKGNYANHNNNKR